MPRPINPPPPAPKHDGRMAGGAMTQEDFELLAVADGLESVAAELSSALDETEKKLFDQALDVYYAAVEMTRNGENPEVLPHVEAMREAYEKTYGRPIPPQEKRDEANKDFQRGRKRRGGP